MKAIYKSVALLFGAMSLFSSCEDFLTRDPQDSPLLSDYLSSDAKLAEYTKQVCGPLTWNGFDDKFSWCVGELYSGNVYHNYADEGQFHFMTFTENNAHISNGYTSLYSVIAKCNHIINDVEGYAKENGLSKDAINRAIGEAKMYRGMAYFFLAEYWGAAPIVLNNNNTITNDLAPEIKRANRKSLYAQIEKDWLSAYEKLPETRQADCRPWKASAAGMLTKLYVTMASCQTKLSNKDYAYECPNPNEYYDKAIKYGNKALGLCDYLASAEEYDKMFQPKTQNPEILFALLFEQGVYAQGCSRQIQFARSKHLGAGGDAYGGEKGLTALLLDSYDKKNDIRLKATSYYFGSDNNYSDKQTKKDAEAGTGHYYLLNDGTKYYYFMNPNKSLSKGERDKFYGGEPVSPVFNHCRKFVYAVKPENSAFSINLTIPLLRVADVYLLMAEAEMGKDAQNVSQTTTAGLKYVNKVRQRAGLDDVDKIAFCVKDEVKGNAYVEEVDITDPNDKPAKAKAECDIINPTYDLMLERRHEFALENQCWLDIKRLFYRDEKAAKQYIKDQCREITYGERWAGDGTPVARPQMRSHFMRQQMIYRLSVAANAINPDYAVQTKEGEPDYNNLQFFLPVPATVTKTGVHDYSKEIEDGSYPY